MWPTLISVGPLAVQSFGLMMFFGIFLGGFLFWQKGREEGFVEESLMDVWLVSGLVGLLMGRVWHVLTNWSNFSGSIYRMLFLTKFPGLSYQGVLVGVSAGLVILGLNKKWQVWRLLEVGVFAFLMVEMFGWLGSFLAGSNLGKATSWFWGLGFPGVEDRRHPVQLVYLLLFFIMFKLFKKWEKEYRGFKWYKADKGEAKTGFLVGAYLIGLSLVKLGGSFLAEIERVVAYYWFYGLIFLLGSLILVVRSGITIKVKADRKAEDKSEKKPSAKLSVDKLRVNRVKIKKKRKKQGFDFK